MIVDVPAVVDGRALGFVDGAVDFVDGCPLVAHDVAPILPPQQRPRVTQIGYRMQVPRMSPVRWRGRGRLVAEPVVAATAHQVDGFIDVAESPVAPFGCPRVVFLL